MNKFKYYSIISGLFSATLVISNTLDTKIFMVGSFAMPAGIILFPVAYLFGDILTEVYGYKASRKVIWTGFCSLILMVLTYELAGKMSMALVILRIIGGVKTSIGTEDWKTNWNYKE